MCTVERCASRQDDPMVEAPAVIGSLEGVKVRRADAPAVLHDSQGLGLGDDPVGVVAGDDDVRHVVSERIVSPELYTRAADLVDPHQPSHPNVGDVIDHIRREQLLKPVEVTEVEQVPVE